jgi:hypothetical protein
METMTADAHGRIKIVSDGTVYGTKVFDAHGNQMDNVVGIEILPISPSGNLVLFARLTFEQARLEMDVDVIPPEASR